ncbi:MAG: hypothetical protein INQ03_15970 [Candidatus Heimdallarchaeota archaeon]|nr:hypothetical protein [Candidatus Heimdallarchaeota archaeon]
MARKTVRKTTYSSTRAKGESSTIEGDRYFLRVDLVSVKLIESSDVLSRSNEIYFKCDRKRIPNKGEIHVEINEVFKPSGGLSLYTQFIEEKKAGTEVVRVQVFDKDASKDDELIDEKISIKLGQSVEYHALEKNGIKVKIGVSAKKTRF